MTIEKSLPVWKHEDKQSSIASPVKRLSALYMLSLCPLSISRCHADAAGYPPLRYICECNANNSCRRTHLAGSAAYAQEVLVTVVWGGFAFGFGRVSSPRRPGYEGPNPKGVASPNYSQPPPPRTTGTATAYQHANRKISDGATIPQ